MSRIRSSLALLVGCVWALGLGGTAALAADMGLPVKAPPPPPPPPSWWSGFVELDGESYLVNPQGQALINNGTATLVAGLNLTLYKDKAGFINNVTVGGLLATDWSNSFPGYWAGVANPSANGALFDVAFILSQSVTFGQYWTLSNEYGNVMSQDVQTFAASPGCVGAKCILGGNSAAGFPTLIFDQVKLSLNDSFTGWPITFNPYVTWYYELQSVGGQGVSAACFSCQVNNYDFFIGMTPTWDWTKQFGVPLTWKVPTYVTVGPASFWNGNPNGLGTISPGGNVGTFTIGLNVTYPLTWMPAQYGHWYVKGGFQWYDVINTSLQVSNAVSICGNTNVSACGSSNTSSILLGFGGVGVAF